MCAFVGVAGLFCAALLGEAALVPAPPDVLPFLSIVCVGCPLTARADLCASVRVLRDLSRLRRQLAALPETHHPLGL